MKEPVRSQKYCSAIVQKRAQSFYSALKFLPKDKRHCLYSLYAFARLADDIVDGQVSHMGLDTLREKLDIVFSSSIQPDQNDFMASLSRTVFDYEIPRKLFDDLLDGMEMDQGKIHFQTWEETKDYCYKAASTVGLMCVEVFEYNDPNARIYAHDLGIAMQLTNMIRDLKEDHSLGRQYLPQEDFDGFGLTYDELVSGQKSDAMNRFMRFQIDRAHVYYESAKNLYPMVNKKTRYCPKALSLIYQKVLETIKQNPAAAIRKKVSLSTASKLWIVTKSFMK